MKLKNDIYVYEWTNAYENNCNSYFIGGNVQALIDPGLTGYVPDLLNRMSADGIKKEDIRYVINTHSHPDHVGLAGWIVDRFNCPLQMSQVEYLQSVYHQNRGTEERKMAQRLFFRRHGMDENLTDKLLGRGQDYLKRVSILPPSYRRISHGEEICDLAASGRDGCCV